jgi:protein O-GlcNAc transferase
MSQGREFLTMCAVFDVVLDTFPVGGGRSSFEIFSVGTPIVLLYPKTSILQLTYGERQQFVSWHD